MMRRTAVLLTLLLTGVVFARAQQDEPQQDRSQPIKFRGAYIGEPLADFVTCPGNKPIDPAFKVHGNLCEEGKGRIENMKSKSRGFMDAMTKKTVQKTLSHDGVEITVVDGKIDAIRIQLPEETDWDNLAADITAKLGKPIDQRGRSFQNKFGAHYDFPLSIWKRDGVIATAGVDAKAEFNGDSITTAGIKVFITSSAKYKRDKPLL